MVLITVSIVSMMLIIFFVYLEISLWVSAYRANLRSLCTYCNVTAVTALPNLDL